MALTFLADYRGRPIQCRSATDRKLLRQANLVGESFANAEQFTPEQLRRMSKACRRYGLDLLEQVTAQLAERLTERQAS